MNITISPDDGLPIYQQIVNQIKYLIASNQLVAGDELPPIRVLAEKLLINPNTVARAYRELDVAGVVVKRGTTGTFVSGAACPLSRRERMRIIRQRIDSLLTEARQLDVEVEEVLNLIKQRDEAMRT